jgi:hypothetical protein
MKTQRLLVVVLVLQALTLMNQWFGGPLRMANAQVPDAGAQRDQMINELKANNDELKGINDKLDKMVVLFDGGKLQVVIAKPDETEKK